MSGDPLRRADSSPSPHHVAGVSADVRALDLAGMPQTGRVSGVVARTGLGFQPSREAPRLAGGHVEAVDVRASLRDRDGHEVRHVSVDASLSGHRGVSGVSVTTDLTGRTDSAATRVLATHLGPAGMRVEARRIDPHAEIEMERDTGSKVSVWSCYHDTSRTARLSVEESRNLKVAFKNVRDYFEAQGVLPEGATQFQVNLSRGTATFMDESGVKQEFDVIPYMEADTECRERMDDLKGYADKVYPVSPHTRIGHSSRSKGNVEGTPPLRRTTTVLKKDFPFSVKDSVTPVMEMVSKRLQGPDEQRAALLRTSVAERYHSGLLKGIDDLIAKKKADLDALKASSTRSADDLHRMAGLQADLGKLNKTRERIQRLDGFAIATALSFFPTGTPSRREIYDRAVMAQGAVEGLHQEKREAEIERRSDPHKDKPWYTRWKHGMKRALGSESSRFIPVADAKNFSYDVAGLMFSGSPGRNMSHQRMDYYDYCSAHDVTMKQESDEDGFVREVLYGLADPTTFDPKTAFASLLTGLSEEMRADLGTTLDGIKTECDAMATRAATAPVNTSATTADKIAAFQTAIKPPTPPSPTPPSTT